MTALGDMNESVILNMHPAAVFHAAGSEEPAGQRKQVLRYLTVIQRMRATERHVLAWGQNGRIFRIRSAGANLRYRPTIG